MTRVGRSICTESNSLLSSELGSSYISVIETFVGRDVVIEGFESGHCVVIVVVVVFVVVVFVVVVAVVLDVSEPDSSVTRVSGDKMVGGTVSAAGEAGGVM